MSFTAVTLFSFIGCVINDLSSKTKYKESRNCDDSREKLRLFREIDVTTRKKSPGTPEGKKIAMTSSFSTNQVVYMPKIIFYIDKRQKD